MWCGCGSLVRAESGVALFYSLQYGLIVVRPPLVYCWEVAGRCSLPLFTVERWLGGAASLCCKRCGFPLFAVGYWCGTAPLLCCVWHIGAAPLPAVWTRCGPFLYCCCSVTVNAALFSAVGDYWPWPPSLSFWPFPNLPCVKAFVHRIFYVRVWVFCLLFVWGFIHSFTEWGFWMIQVSFVWGFNCVKSLWFLSPWWQESSSSLGKRSNLWGGSMT